MIEVDVLIQQGRLINPKTQTDQVCDIAITGDRISFIAEHSEECRAVEEINAQGKWVLPGLVDLSVRMREPGHEAKATIESETRAAVAGGITTAMCPPDTDPVIDSAAEVELLRRLSKRAARCWVAPIGALTKGLEGKELAEMGSLRKVDCRAVSNAMVPIEDSRVLLNSLSYAATHNIPVFVQPTDPWLGRDGLVHDGKIAARLGLPGIPEAAETAEVSRVLALAKAAGARVHFCRLSTGRAVELIKHARDKGQKVTADVAIHQLFLTEGDVYPFNADCYVKPPLRTQADRDALLQGINDGVIQAICSDHQPLDKDARENPFGETEPGISGLDSLLPLTLRLVEDGDLSLMDAVACLTSAPAKILGIDIGSLERESRANLTIVDPDTSWQLTRDNMVSQGKNSPFINYFFGHRVTDTLFEGRRVFPFDKEHTAIQHADEDL